MKTKRPCSLSRRILKSHWIRASRLFTCPFDDLIQVLLAAQVLHMDREPQCPVAHLYSN